MYFLKKLSEKYFDASYATKTQEDQSHVDKVEVNDAKNKFDNQKGE